MTRWTAKTIPAHIALCISPRDRAAIGLSPIDPSNHTPEPQKPLKQAKESKTKASKQPNPTEERYRRDFLEGLDARYEALSFKLKNGHRYTPDWVVVSELGFLECHEVKGAYKFHSQSRARMAYDQCRIEWPAIRWVWATWTGEKWRVEG
jgi:hypothetical protein